jgi:hypothetical protein
LGLIFDCLSFTEGLITSLSTADGEAPASSKTIVTSVRPHFADRCRGACSNRVIELNQKKLILKRFVTKDDFLYDDDN